MQLTQRRKGAKQAKSSGGVFAPLRLCVSQNYEALAPGLVSLRRGGPLHDERH